MINITGSLTDRQHVHVQQIIQMITRLLFTISTLFLPDVDVEMKIEFVLN